MASASRLMDKVNDRLKKAKVTINEEEFEVMYPTGFLTLDAANGSMIHVNGNGIVMRYRSTGIVDGSSNMVIGRSNCGKSTLTIQIIGNIAKQFEDTHVYIDDIEGSLPMSRKEFLLNMSEEDLKRKVHFRNTGINTENVFQQILAIHDTKLEARADWEYDTGKYDTYGNRLFKLIPTLYLIDSFAMLLPEDIMDKEELDGGMGATAVAKKNTQLVKKMSQLLREANIILFSVNHINDDPQTGFLPKPAQISGLKQGERLPGGKAALYIANNMFRLDDAGQLKESEGYGINGQVVNLQIVKSRTNQNRRVVPLIFDKSHGAFDPVLSMYHYMKQEGMISGAGARMYFEENPDIKWSQKEFKKCLNENAELQQLFMQKCSEALDPLLSDVENQKTIHEGFDLLSAMTEFYAA